MPIRKFRNLVCALIVIASLGGGGAYIAKAGNTYLNVTVSNITGVSSPDPYSLVEPKDDDDPLFHITLYTLTNSSEIYFTAYRTPLGSTTHNLSSDTQVSVKKTIKTTDLGETKHKAYYSQAYAIPGRYYYVFTTSPLYTCNVNAVGHYCP